MPDYYNKLTPEQKTRMYKMQAAVFFGIIAAVLILIGIVELAK